MRQSPRYLGDLRMPRPSARGLHHCPAAVGRDAESRLRALGRLLGRTGALPLVGRRVVIAAENRVSESNTVNGKGSAGCAGASGMRGMYRERVS